jgi:hypothetical protein
VLRNLKSRGLKDVLDPEVINAYSEWNDIKKNGLALEAEDIQSFSEQIVYRTSRCKTCVDAGECIDGERPCHCPMPAKAHTPLAKCSEGRWPQMMPHDDWTNYKAEKGIEVIAIQP